jgi:hypothetical protein
MNTAKRFLIHGGLLFGLLACGGQGGEPAAPNENPVFVQANTPFQLRPGTTVSVGDSGLLIAFRGVGSDSRCPTDVVCVWAGDAVARIQVTVGRMAWTSHDLHTTLEPREIQFREWTIRLVSLEPARQSNREIPAGQYLLTLEVTR